MKRLLLVFSLVIAFSLLVFSMITFAEKEEPFSHIKEKMAKISEEEREILQNLFILVQEIEEMEREEAEYNQNIEKAKQEIERLQVIIADEKVTYEKKKENLKQLLRSYQRMGPGTYLEIILDSDNLVTLIRRINALRDITRNTGVILDQLEGIRENQLKQKVELAGKLDLMEDSKKQFMEFVANKKKLKEDKEVYLASLGKDREYYQEYLDNVQIMWDQLKSLFSETMKELSSIINKGDLPLDAVKIAYSFFNIKGSLDEEILNDIITGHAQLPKMVFRFYPGKVEMEVPEKSLILTGTFVILEGHTLKFMIDEGSFYGLPLETGAIEELFQGDYLILNLKPLLGSFTLNSIEIKDGHLELLVVPEIGGDKDD